MLDLSLKQFIESIGARTSAPGGGSASACIGSIGAALATMVSHTHYHTHILIKQLISYSLFLKVGLMTYGKRQYDSLDGKMREAIKPLYDAMQLLMEFIDKDTSVFNSYMVSLWME